CDSLGQLGAVDYAPALEQIAIDGSSASSAATAALVALPRQPATDRLLCEVAAHASASQALLAAREMRGRGGCPLEPLIQSLAAAFGSPSRTGRPKGRQRQSRDPREIAASLDTLAALGATAPAVLSRVRQLLEDDDAELRLSALNAAAELAQ